MQAALPALEADVTAGRRTPAAAARPSSTGLTPPPAPFHRRNLPRPTATTHRRAACKPAYPSVTAVEPTAPSNFLQDLIAADLASGKTGGRVALRFPPEPNGFPHLGHAKSICLNFGLAQQFGGTCNLRYDDTNPETEEQQYVDALADAVRWLGFAPAAIVHASDYFEQLYAGRSCSSTRASPTWTARPRSRSARTGAP